VAGTATESRAASSFTPEVGEVSDCPRPGAGVAPPGRRLYLLHCSLLC
jgi:hypothetical protein